MPIKALAFDVYGTLFDPRSVARAVEAAFPGHGDFIASVWRQKQLEYTWLRSAMGRFADFETVTREALVHAVLTVRPSIDERIAQALCAAFDRLTPFEESKQALDRLAWHRLAILSNGSGAMLNALLQQAEMEAHFPVIVSSTEVGAYKPHPAFYGALVTALDLPPEEIALVSSNGFDLAGAKHFGLRTIRIARVAPEDLREATGDGTEIGSAVAFTALRSQMDDLAGAPDATCTSLIDLAAIAGALE